MIVRLISEMAMRNIQASMTGKTHCQGKNSSAVIPFVLFLLNSKFKSCSEVWGMNKVTIQNLIISLASI